jgi:hypothetical protein
VTLILPPCPHRFSNPFTGFGADCRKIAHKILPLPVHCSSRPESKSWEIKFYVFMIAFSVGVLAVHYTGFIFINSSLQSCQTLLYDFFHYLRFLLCTTMTGGLHLILLFTNHFDGYFICTQVFLDQH